MHGQCVHRCPMYGHGASRVNGSCPPRRANGNRNTPWPCMGPHGFEFDRSLPYNGAQADKFVLGMACKFTTSSRQAHQYRRILLCAACGSCTTVHGRAGTVEESSKAQRYILHNLPYSPAQHHLMLFERDIAIECGGVTNAPMAVQDIPPERIFQRLSGNYLI
jgi:hypothetical protein